MLYLKSFRGISVDLQISNVNGKITLSKLRKYEQSKVTGSQGVTMEWQIRSSAISGHLVQPGRDLFFLPVKLAGFVSLEACSLYKFFYILGISTVNRFEKSDINPVFSLATNNNWDTLNR